MNNTITTIMQQINWRDLNLAGFKFIKMNDNTLRLHKGKKNFDIEYNYGADTYTISRHTIKPDWTCQSETISDIYFDQLQELIAEFFKFEYVTI